MAKFQVQVRGEWAGIKSSSWRPAIDGTINQTGLPAVEASTYTGESEADEALELCVAEGASRDDLRVVEL